MPRGRLNSPNWSAWPRKSLFASGPQTPDFRLNSSTPIRYASPMSNFYDAVYTLVRDIPPGRVMTYGQIATILGAPRAARAVGYALRALSPGTDVPWQRVINGKGGVSARGDVERPAVQYELLEEEGVFFGADGHCELSTYRWEPEHPEDYHFTPGEDLPF